ncbi:MAG: hypothetical protein L3J14_06560, partial [Flavobacteriaceae bacterium]|nr:hypothetical protein [Flavobacteriaceae bacterium]
DLFYNNEIKVFTVFSPSKKERIVYCHIYNMENNTHNKVELFKTTVDKNQNIFFGKSKRQTSFAVSPNNKYLVISTDNIRKNSNSYTVRVFDASNLKLQFQKKYQEYEENYFEPNDIIIDSDATTFILGKLFLKGKRQKKKGKANYQFILNKITEKNTKNATIKLSEEEHINSLSILNEREGIKLIGFYSEKNANKIKGTCSFKINQRTMEISEKKINELPLKVYEDLYSYRKSKKKKELSSFEVDYIIEDSEGNTFLLAEEFYITTHYVSNGQYGGYWVTTYHYNDVLILKFNKNGDLEWGRSIFKRSTSPSYNAFLKDDELHVILNSGKNLTEKKDGRTKASKGWFESSALYDFEYQINGEVSYNKIQNNKGKTYYLPYLGSYYNGKFIMASDARKKKQFMVLE